MSFSLIYICCSFRGGILSVVFPTVAKCFWPAGNLECPCLFSDLILFPFLLLFFYIVPYPSFSSMSFSLIYICCSFRGGILSVVCPFSVAICFWPAGVLECPCPFSDLILFPFLLLFLLYCACTLAFLLCLFHWSISARALSSSLFSSFSSILFLTLPVLLCLFHWSISAVVSGEAFYLLFSRTVAICFWPAGNLECPCLFSDLILFPFLLLFFYIVPTLPFLYVFFIDLYLL